MSEENSNAERVQVVGYGYDGIRLNIKGNKEQEKVLGVVNGCLWMGVTDGKVEFISRYNSLPKTQEDERLLPFWSGGRSIKYLEVRKPKVDCFSPSFDIQHLCGYYYTPERYEEEAAKLESYGFFCMRSKRGPDGKYWEVWRLSGDWAAEGELKLFCEELCEKRFDDKKKAEEICRWLCRNCSFGTLDLVTQRAAMTMDG